MLSELPATQCENNWVIGLLLSPKQFMITFRVFSMGYAVCFNWLLFCVTAITMSSSPMMGDFFTIVSTKIEC